MPVYVESTILELPNIPINGGRRGYLVGIDPQVLRATARGASRCSARWQNSRPPTTPIAREPPCRSYTSLRRSRSSLSYLIGSLSFAVIVSRAHGHDRPAQLRQQATRAPPTCCARATSARRIPTLLLDALKGWLPVFADRAASAPLRAWAQGTVALVGPGGLPRPPVAGVLPLPGRQGRGHGRRRAARHSTRWLGLATLRHLAHHRGLLPLLVAGVHRGRASSRRPTI